MCLGHSSAWVSVHWTLPWACQRRSYSDPDRSGENSDSGNQSCSLVTFSSILVSIEWRLQHQWPPAITCLFPPQILVRPSSTRCTVTSSVTWSEMVSDSREYPSIGYAILSVNFLCLPYLFMKLIYFICCKYRLRLGLYPHLHENSVYLFTNTFLFTLPTLNNGCFLPLGLKCCPTHIVE